MDPAFTWLRWAQGAAGVIALELSWCQCDMGHGPGGFEPLFGGVEVLLMYQWQIWVGLSAHSGNKERAPGNVFVDSGKYQYPTPTGVVCCTAADCFVKIF